MANMQATSTLLQYIGENVALCLAGLFAQYLFIAKP